MADVDVKQEDGFRAAQGRAREMPGYLRKQRHLFPLFTQLRECLVISPLGQRQHNHSNPSLANW